MIWLHIYSRTCLFDKLLFIIGCYQKIRYLFGDELLYNLAFVTRIFIYCLQSTKLWFGPIIMDIFCIVIVNKDVHNCQTRLLKIGKEVSDVPVSITFYQNIMRQLYASICLSKVQFGVSNKKDESEKK